MRISMLKSAIVMSAILSLGLLNGCFFHHRHDDDDRVVVPAGYHEHGDWHRDYDHDRHDRDYDRY